MKKIAFFISALALLASCNNEELTANNSGTGSDEGISFNLYQDADGTRTEYSTADWLQIDWKYNDSIKIFCAETIGECSPSKNGVCTTRNTGIYHVTSTIAAKNSAGVTTNSQARIAAMSNDDVLYWNEGQHTFYAVYGNGNDVTSITAEMKDGKYTGKFTCKYNKEQTLSKDQNGAWVCMSQAYMIAKKITAPTANVDLHFKPIMTTLEIQIKGMADAPVYLSSVEITVPASQDKTDANGYFTYDYETGTASQASSPAAETYKFVWADPSEAEIPKNGSITLIAILPPIDIAANDLVLDVKTAGWNSKKMKIDKAVSHGQKARIATKSWSFDKTAAVDMGSSLGSWATVNIGADQPTDYGYHLSWAYNTTNTNKNKSHYTSIEYSPVTSLYSYPTLKSIAWNNTDFQHYGYALQTADSPTTGIKGRHTFPEFSDCLYHAGYTDQNTYCLVAAHDYAYQMDGWKNGSWKTPNMDELNALCARDQTYSSNPLVTRKWVRMKNKNGQYISGVLLISKANGNCVFLGAWGKLGSEDDKTGTDGREKFTAGCYYWSTLSTDDSGNSECEQIFVTQNNGVGTITAAQDNHTRGQGMQIRPKRR